MSTFPKGHSARITRRRRIPEREPVEPVNLADARAYNITAIQLLNRDGPNCYLCQRQLPPNYEIEHILPRVHGGRDHPNNLALACQSCNRRKNDRFVSIRIKDRMPCYWIAA